MLIQHSPFLCNIVWKMTRISPKFLLIQSPNSPSLHILHGIGPKSHPLPLLDNHFGQYFLYQCSSVSKLPAFMQGISSPDCPVQVGGQLHVYHELFSKSCYQSLIFFLLHKHSRNLHDSLHINIPEKLLSGILNVSL